MDYLEKYRRNIDLLDEKIIDLLAKRMAISAKIGKYKKNRKLRVTDNGREKTIMLRLTERAKARKLPPQFIRRTFNLIFRQSRKVQDG